MTTAVADKSINWQIPSVDDSKISEEDYRAMVGKAENSGYMSYETHYRKFNEWFNKFAAMRLKTKGFTFNREEAHER